jgi:polar amino acid transport system substrate-binding protein
MGNDRRDGESHWKLSRRGLVAASISTVAPAGILSQFFEPRSALAQTAAAGRLDRILKSGKLRVGQFLQYKPYGFKTATGEPDGFDVELTKMLAVDMGVTVEFVDNTWEGIIPALLADKFDLITAHMAVTIKRSLTVQFADPHSFTTPGFIFREQDAGRFATLDKFNDPSVTISILIQDAVHTTLQRFFSKAKVVDFNSAQEAILAVQTNKVDVSAAEISFLTQYAKEHQGLSARAVDYPGSANLAAIAMVPGPDNDHLMRFLNTWVKFFYWTGKFQPLWEKWVPGVPLPKVEKFMAPV